MIQFRFSIWEHFAEVNDLAKSDYESVLAGSMTVDDMISDLDTQGSSIFASYGD